MDGRRGLVPIIFIQKLSGDELLEFNQRVLAGMKECDDSASTTIPQDIENLNSGIRHFFFLLKLFPSYFMRTKTIFVFYSPLTLKYLLWNLKQKFRLEDGLGKIWKKLRKTQTKFDKNMQYNLEKTGVEILGKF